MFCVCCKEAQFEQLTRELEAERQSVANQLEKVSTSTRACASTSTCSCLLDVCSYSYVQHQSDSVNTQSKYVWPVVLWLTSVVLFCLWWLFVGTCTCRLTANVFRHAWVSALSWKQPANVIERQSRGEWEGERGGRQREMSSGSATSPGGAGGGTMLCSLVEF